MRRGATALPSLPPVCSHCRAAEILLFFLRWRQISADTLEHFRRHADRFRQGRVWMDGLADIDGITPHLDCETHFSDQVSGMRAHDAAAKQPVVTVVEKQLGEALVAPVRDRPTRCRPR